MVSKKQLKKKILITGSSGFIGRNLKEYLEKKYDVSAPSSAELNLLDAKAAEDYLKKNRFDEIIHAAVYRVTRNSDKDPQLDISNNLRMFFNLAHCNKLYSRLFYFGSGAEYGKQKPIVQVREEDFEKRIPVDDYGFFKYVINSSLPSFPTIYNLRLFGVFGKYEDYEIRFISQVLCRLLLNKKITINRNVYFDYLYIDDLVRIVERFIEMKLIPFQTINVCTGKRIDLLTIADHVKKIAGKNMTITISHNGLSNEYTAQNKLLKKLLPDMSFTSLNNALGELFQWYSENKGKIDKKLL